MSKTACGRALVENVAGKETESILVRKILAIRGSRRHLVAKKNMGSSEAGEKSHPPQTGSGSWGKGTVSDYKDSGAHRQVLSSAGMSLNLCLRKDNWSYREKSPWVGV